MILFVEVEYISSDKFNNDYPEFFEKMNYSWLFERVKIDNRYEVEFYRLLEKFIFECYNPNDIYTALKLNQKALLVKYSENSNIKYDIDHIEFAQTTFKAATANLKHME